MNDGNRDSVRVGRCVRFVVLLSHFLLWKSVEAKGCSAVSDRWRVGGRSRGKS